MRGLMKLAGVARFDCIGSTQEFTCYMAGLASPRRSHLRLDDQHAAQSPCLAILVPLGCGASSTTSFIADLAGGLIPYPRSTGPDHAAMHPLRRDTPDPSRCTRSEEVQCLRIGCSASHNKHSCGRSLPTHPNRQHQARPHSLKMLTQAPNERRYTRYVAVHPIRRGAMPTDRVHRYLQQVSVWRYASTPRRNTRQRSSAATEETVHHRETGTGDEAANSSTHQLLGHSTTRTTCACQRLRSLCGDNHTISSLLRHTSSHGR